MKVICARYGGEDVNNQRWGGYEHEAVCWCGSVQDLVLRDDRFICSLHLTWLRP